MSNSSNETVSFSYKDFYLVGALPWIYTDDKHRKLLLEISPGTEAYRCRVLCGKYIHHFQLLTKPPHLAIGSWTFSSAQWSNMAKVLDKIFLSVNAPVEMEVVWNQWTIVSPAIGLSLPCSMVDEYS